MSIATEIQRIQQAKADIKTAINNKGGTLSDTATIDTFASAIDNLPSGSGGSSSSIVRLTQAAYDNLATKDANTIYLIIG